MTLDEARMLAATHARQLEMAARGHELLHMGGEPMSKEQIAAWATMNAEAIRLVIQAAGLPADWRNDQGIADGVFSSNAL